MAWFTTKKGKRVNTDWFLKDEQIKRNKEVADKLNVTEHPVTPIGGKRIKHEDWKRLDTDVNKYGIDTGEKKLAGNDIFDGQPQKAVQAKVYDRDRWVQEKDIRPVKKADAIREVEAWRNDDGTYGTGDEMISVYYEDGSHITLTELNPGEKWSKRGIRGISVSTGDYQMVWGEEPVRRNGFLMFEPIQTTEFDENGNNLDEGYSNAYSDYKNVGHYKERRFEQDIMAVQVNKTGHDKYGFPKNEIRYKERHQAETLQRSTVKWNDSKKEEIAAKNEKLRQAKRVEENPLADPATRISNNLSKKGISNEWEIENHLRSLSPTRRNRLAKEMGIEGRGDDKTKAMAHAIFLASKNVPVTPVKVPEPPKPKEPEYERSPKMDFIDKRIEGAKANIAKLEKKKSRIEEAKATNWEKNPYLYGEQDLRRANHELDQAKQALSRYEEDMQKEIQKAKSRNVPAITEFLDGWEKRSIEYFKEQFDKYGEARAAHRLEQEAFDAKTRWDSPLSKEEKIELSKQARSQRKKFNEDWMHVTQFFDGPESWEENMIKAVKKEKIAKYDDIVERTNYLIGQITDAGGLHIGKKGDLNGIIVGKNGKATVETIGAGGYNIQRYHFRTLINKLKENK